MAKETVKKVGPPDIITFRHGDKMVYVTPTSVYEEALAVAQDEFYESFSAMKKDRLFFKMSVYAPTGAAKGQRKEVIIGKTAWPAVLASLKRFEIIDIAVKLEDEVKDVSVPPDIISPPPDYTSLRNDEKPGGKNKGGDSSSRGSVWRRFLHVSA